ncbi:MULTISPECIES: cytochrome P450 [unclassified Corynebacterium]|uniref:cytochrome P450 n=1 Tax=unclassified Corynebacterium TaxID=2624378 RepID=UPI00264CFFE8|nr:MULTISPECIES: cytochrome P450 [unclassified Corynebacterium]MDN8594451.1 cytochrome P450 [Corynebacterium sp. P4_F2]WKK56247.1 cytochrome P450 [Corynebacterium sp. P4-C1]WKK63661.1 cytochrome P450 [Corynebacterium sp. P8-C1]
MQPNGLDESTLAGTEPRAFADALLGAGTRLAKDGDEVVVTGHDLAREVAETPEKFSSAVSRFMQLPNGLDGEEHAKVRTMIERYLDAPAVEGLEPAFREIARAIIADAAKEGMVDAVGDVGAQFAVRAMTAWLGWPAEVNEELVAWVADNNAATRSGQLERTAAVAERFDDIIRSVVAPLQENPDDSVTSRLIYDDSLGRPLEFEEVVSILRNWTAGDLSSMAYCIGVIVEALIQHPELKERLGQGVSRAEFTAIADEILRADSPFVSNRRITTCPVSLDGVELPEGQKVRIHWTAANRDPETFDDVDGFDPEANAPQNLVWGAGPHACPGKDLSVIELQAFTEELCAAVELSRAGDGEREIHPVGGWASLPVRLTARG